MTLFEVPSIGRRGLSALTAGMPATVAHPVRMRMEIVAGLRKTELTAWAQRCLTPGSAVVSDGLNCCPRVVLADCTHEAIVTEGGAATEPAFVWVNTLLGNVKNALHGTYHALRPKYLQRYLSEFCYRFNRRFELAALVPRLLYAAVRTPPLPYKIAAMDM